MSSRLFYVQKLKNTLTTSIIFNVIFGLTLIIPVVMIVTGAMNINECTLNPLIPKWLIIGGSIVFVNHSLHLGFNISEICRERRRKRQRDISDYGKLQENAACTRIERVLRAIFLLLILGWLIVATILSLPNFKKVSHDKNIDSSTYCNKRCFEVILMKTILMWAIWFIILTIVICLVIYGSIKERNQSKQSVAITKSKQKIKAESGTI